MLEDDSRGDLVPMLPACARAARMRERAVPAQRLDGQIRRVRRIAVAERGEESGPGGCDAERCSQGPHPAAQEGRLSCSALPGATRWRTLA